MGIFKVTIGVMGSSKSTRAIADVKNARYEGLKVLVIKPQQDVRDGDKISSRLIKESIQADITLSEDAKLDKKSIIESNYDIIVADELHMLSVQVVEDLYEISAVSDTDIFLYGLAMSWKGKPFMSTAIALAYADKIDRIETTDKHKNLLTHHIKKVGNMPCDITKDGGEIHVGDVVNGEYFTVSKQTFYQIYGMLGQINTKQEEEVNEKPKNLSRTSLPKHSKLDDSDKKKLRDDFIECFKTGDTDGDKKSRKRKAIRYAYPMVGHVVKLKPEKMIEICSRVGDIPASYFTITDIVGDKYGINLMEVMKGQVFLDIEDFVILIDGQYYEPKILRKPQDAKGRYLQWL